jgi:predicted MPP superfamily phosphohydrolase
MTQKKMNDDALAKKLRRNGKITTPGKPFKESQRIEIEALINNGIFRIKPYDSIKYGKFRIFKSRIVNEIKGKATNSLYEKSQIMIQVYSDDGKKMMLTQFSTIQRASQKMILAIAPTLLKQSMHLWLRNITQAYTQSKSFLQRIILAHLPKQIRHFYPEGSIIIIV